jgi:biotin transporter BioY
MRQSPAPHDTSESSDVARLVRLHHRRRGWTWVAVISLIGLVVYTGIGVSLFANLTGTAETASIVPVFVLLALVVIGLVTVIVDTVRIHRADAAVRASASDSVSHYPLYAQAHRHPPKHHVSWAFGVFALVAMTVVNVAILPIQVNSVAYLTGAESRDTFNPVSYGQACSKGGCQTVTEGYLSNSGANVTWEGQVPLGQPFTVRVPVWAWGTGRNLIDGDGTAIAMVIVGLIFDGFSLLLLLVLIVALRHRLSRRRQGIGVPAVADSTAFPRTHHPDLPLRPAQVDTAMMAG